jgi:hypothetical protein
MLKFIGALAFLSSLINLSTTLLALALGAGSTDGLSLLIGLGLEGVGLVPGATPGFVVGWLGAVCGLVARNSSILVKTFMVDFLI